MGSHDFKKHPEKSFFYNKKQAEKKKKKKAGVNKVGAIEKPGHSASDNKPKHSESDNKPKHSPIGASSMSRWAACPGSVALSKDQPNKAGVAALEGTAAHELIGLALERAFSRNIPTRTVLENTLKAVLVYADYCEKLKGEANPYHIEHSFDMHTIHEGLYGTADFVAFDPIKRILHVVDYKHGEGLPVEVEDNMQLQYYALGALSTLGYICQAVSMTIVQPRCYHPAGPIRSWVVPSLHFIDFEADLVKAAKETKKKNAKLQAGSHCIFCPAKSICTEKHSDNVKSAKRDFNFYSDPKKDFEPVAVGGTNTIENIFD